MTELIAKPMVMCALFPGSKFYYGKNMENGFEMGKVVVKSVPVDCKMNAGTNAASTGLCIW